MYATRPNVPDFLVKGGVTYRILSDQVGSVRLVVDASTGAIAQRIDYDAFGVVTQDTNPGFQPFGFAGRLIDGDTGLVRFGARDYDPRIGRWTTKDPIRFEGSQSNLYEYALTDPVNLIDPEGELAQIAGGFLGGALAGGLAGGAVGATREILLGRDLGCVFSGAAKGAAIGALVGGVTGALATAGVLTPFQVSALEAAGAGRVGVFIEAAKFGFFSARLPGPLGAFAATLFSPDEAGGGSAQTCGCS